QLRASTHRTKGTGFGLLPTTTAQDFKRRGPNSRQQGLSNTENWVNLLPTPTTNDAKNATMPESQNKRGGLTGSLHHLKDGKTSQLNPRFVLEMMGFPPDWTELPFLSGETNLSKQQETP